MMMSDKIQSIAAALDAKLHGAASPAPTAIIAEVLRANLPGWQPIETAPKDGTAIIVLSKGGTLPDSEGGPDIVCLPEAFLVKWNAEGSAWVDRDSGFVGKAHHLEVTGTWDTGDGWLQPNEVTHWMPLPEPPK